MLGRTHLLFSLFLSLLFLNVFFVKQSIFFVAIFVLGSIIPDIDESSSIIGRKLKFVSWFFSHRGFFHSIFSAIIFSSLVLFLFGLYYSLVFLTGFISHLFLDSLTKNGVSLFLFDKKIKGFLVSGGLFEIIFGLVLFFLNVYLLIILLL